ncbi:sugar phosphate permease [Diaminobutyricimonas aerilata]|uniref:Sugar phosphate permease n=1 Tax=Diaminobutyricimonas aerilata TaxID=1162967 RepID=A0A2M9CLS4_9MICO|nr:MFS transporter [Diaminobutyricimonas aerilata]PJJ72818.1 sugar phosphate permease [Diaminobutyricimonas aerilata]
MRSSTASHSAFAAFGLFWGTWGAALPALRDAASVTDAELGTALLLVGLGALPAMMLTGRAVDRFGARIAGALMLALALSGLVIAIVSRDFATLALGMLLVGATSGAADVASNALAGLAEQRSGGRVITISHAVFSSFVVVGSLGTGGLRALGADAVAVFAGAAALMAVASVAVLMLGDRPHAATPTVAVRRREAMRLALPFVAVGLVGAVAFATENAHQSWSAIFLADELDASVGLTAIAPATFAVFAALTRFAAGIFTRVPAGLLLLAGAGAALLGTLVLATATVVPVALGGLALAAMGTSVLFPTLLSRATEGVPADRRGRATSAVATTAYLGFLVGPVYVGLLADGFGLRGAMIGVAVLAALFALLAPLVTRRRNANTEASEPAPATMGA